MTHDILQSDIELAIRLRDEQSPDEEILKELQLNTAERKLLAQQWKESAPAKPLPPPAPVPIPNVSSPPKSSAPAPA